MRISVHGTALPASGGDVDPGSGLGLDADVDPGLPAGVLRRHLALLTGDARWAAGASRLVVDGAELDDAHPAGVPPLLPGARAALRAPVRADPTVAAALADVHVAVVAGPDAGHLRALPLGGRLEVLGAEVVGEPRDGGRRPGAVRAGRDGGRPRHTVVRRGRSERDAGPADACVLRDPALAGVRVEVRRTRRGARVRVVGAAGLMTRARGTGRGAGDTGAAGGRGAEDTGDARGRGPGDARGSGPRAHVRVRRVGARARRWTPTDALHVGGSVLRLRGAVPRAPRRRPTPSPWVWSALASTAGGVALALALRQPLLLVGAAVGVVGLLAGRARTTDSTPDPGPRGADGAPVTVTATDAPPADVAGVRAGAVRRSHGADPTADPTGSVATPGRAWPADGTLALVGTRAEALAAARAVVLRALASAPGAPLVVQTSDAAAWAWTRWLGPGVALPTADVSAAVVVADGADATLGRWRAAAPASHLLVLVVPPGSRPPAWARTVVRLAAGRAVRTDSAGRRTVAVAELLRADVAEDAARSLAATRWLPGAAAGDGPDLPGADAWPAAPVLGALPGVPSADADDVAHRWADAATARLPLHAPLGAAADGSPVVLDLDADGAHVLVGGTTGAGKSELLTTVVLGLALQHPPHRLALLLADFKGGTGLGPLAGLPHVVDHVDDLDAGAARRTLTALRAELRRRERLLAAAGAADLRRLDADDPTTPPRLVVVVDELRALVDDVPDAVDVLARIAAQGRALGVHLVLATQRPAGVVTADLRANVGQRVALRVADEADSRDVVDAPDAARIDPAHPGRAVVRVGARAPRTVQVARARHRGRTAGVRLLPSGAGGVGGGGAGVGGQGVSGAGVGGDGGSGVGGSGAGVGGVGVGGHGVGGHGVGGRGVAGAMSGSPLRGVDMPGGHLRGGDVPGGHLPVGAAPGGTAPGGAAPGGAVPGSGWHPRGPVRSASDDVAAWVMAARRAAEGRRGPGVPWCPALPPVVATADVPPGDGLALALADVPDEQRRAPVRWRPAAGPLLVLGGPGSGRSTALLTVAAEAARRGTHVHAVGLPAAGLRAVVDPSVLGTVVPLDDAHRTGLLLHRLLTDARDRPAAVLLVDRLDVLLESLGRHARGVAADLLATTWRDPVPGVALAASAAVVPSVTRLLGDFPTRLVLPVVDPSADALAGVPAGPATARTAPGRAVVCGTGPALLCQVAVPPPVADPTPVTAPPVAARPRVATPPPATAPAPEPGSLQAAGADPGRAGGAPLRVAALPAHVPPDGTATVTLRDPSAGLPLGVGGDDGGPVHAGAGDPLVVAGPPGSGRTTALRVVARAWSAAGHRVLRVAAGGARDDEPGAPWRTVDPADLRADDRDTHRPVEAVPPAGGPAPRHGHPAAIDAGPGRAGGSAGAGTGDLTVVVVDDADELDRAAPAAAELVDDLLRGGAPRVVALATTTAYAAGAFRGPVPTALRSRHVLVLDPHDADAAALLGPSAALHADPAHRVPGRGVLRTGRTLVRVQVHADVPPP